MTRDGVDVVLTAREFTLLRYLIDKRGSMVSSEDLLHQVWGHQAIPTTRTVDVHVAWLRQKLEENPKYPQYILTIRGLGISLLVEVSRYRGSESCFVFVNNERMSVTPNHINPINSAKASAVYKPAGMGCVTGECMLGIIFLKKLIVPVKRPQNSALR